MPNWCDNRLTVIGPAGDIARFAEQAKGPVQSYPNDGSSEPPIEVFSFQALVPLPPEATAGNYDPNGIEAERATWGVKWGGSDSVLVKRTRTRLIYTFKTPWGPARDFHSALARKWPTLTFALSYSEEYPSRGRYIWRNKRRKQVTYTYGTPSHIKFNDKLSEREQEKRYRKLEKWRWELVKTHDKWIRTLEAK